MIPKMRRSKQQLSREESEAILHKATSGVLALEDADGYPYAVPLSCLYLDGKLIFHGAKEGHKLNLMRKNAKASFCVIDRDEVVPEEYTTYFRSVIAFGTIRILETAEEMLPAIRELAEKYRPGHAEERERAVQREFDQMCMFELEIEHLTGKEAIELVQAKK